MEYARGQSAMEPVLFIDLYFLAESLSKGGDPYLNRNDKPLSRPFVSEPKTSEVRSFSLERLYTLSA
jgi:hypothetical protein